MNPWQPTCEMAMLRACLRGWAVIGLVAAVVTAWAVGRG